MAIKLGISNTEVKCYDMPYIYLISMPQSNWLTVFNQHLLSVVWCEWNLDSGLVLATLRPGSMIGEINVYLMNMLQSYSLTAGWRIMLCLWFFVLLVISNFRGAKLVWKDWLNLGKCVKNQDLVLPIWYFSFVEMTLTIMFTILFRRSEIHKMPRS